MAHLKVLRLPVVIERAGRKKSTLYKDIAAGRFPRPIKLGARSVGWIEAEVDEWLAARIVESRGRET